MQLDVVGLEQLSGHGMEGKTGTLASDAGVDLKQNDTGWPADYCKSTVGVGKIQMKTNCIYICIWFFQP